MITLARWRGISALAGLGMLSGCASELNAGDSAAVPVATRAQPGVSARPEWPRYTLELGDAWQLRSSGVWQFDASGLLLLPGGELLTVNDRGPTVYQVKRWPGSNVADLEVVSELFVPSALAALTKHKACRFDCEGLARDDKGRIYSCEESNRWILRCEPESGKVERLPIDWSPVKKYFSILDSNASFEGIAVGGGRLYVANERWTSQIIVVDENNYRVLDHFAPRPWDGQGRESHYSDLCWHEGALYVLVRNERVILKVDPAAHRVLAEYCCRNLERAPEFAYHTLYPTGVMEGLAVERDCFWLVTDNNGQGRIKHPADRRPTLFKCRRPDC